MTVRWFPEAGRSPPDHPPLFSPDSNFSIQWKRRESLKADRRWGTRATSTGNSAGTFSLFLLVERTKSLGVIRTVPLPTCPLPTAHCPLSWESCVRMWSELKLPPHARGCGGFASPCLLPESGVMGDARRHGRDLCRMAWLSREWRFCSMLMRPWDWFLVGHGHGVSCQVEFAPGTCRLTCLVQSCQCAEFPPHPCCDERHNSPRVTFIRCLKGEIKLGYPESGYPGGSSSGD